MGEVQGGEGQGQLFAHGQPMPLQKDFAIKEEDFVLQFKEEELLNNRNWWKVGNIGKVSEDMTHHLTGILVLNIC